MLVSMELMCLGTRDKLLGSESSPNEDFVSRFERERRWSADSFSGFLFFIKKGLFDVSRETKEC